ncbi:MAG TPA: succinylglutamate desuccinylase/aspartoacylase family protein [Candidatus Baltobacteraceae bacterium]|nr:succinylglutamate desuccinylase/aspartoacylase family protein [Candidatus Baltobacteraceae bacterium]
MRNYDDLQARWKALRAAREIAVREVACIGAARTLLCVDFGSAHAPAVALTAGVHGDEPAAPWALLALVEDADLDPHYAYRVWPCTNPSGYAAGTRENADGVDVNRSFGRGGQTPEARAMVTANRDRKFALSIDLHEDCDAEGFYCYEYGAGDLGAIVVDAVRGAGYPVQDLAQCDLGAPLSGVMLDDGVVRPPAALEIDAIGGLSYTLSVVRHATRRALTFETPIRLAWEERIAIHRIAVKAAILALSNLEDHG